MIPLSILLWNVHTVLLPYPLRPNFNSVARMEDKISSMKLQIRISFEAVHQGYPQCKFPIINMSRNL